MTDDFFRNRLDQMIDLRQPLAVLANCRIPDDHKDALQTNADAKRTSLSWLSSVFCS
jgi:hypothetical protein